MHVIERFYKVRQRRISGLHPPEKFGRLTWFYWRIRDKISQWICLLSLESTNYMFFSGIERITFFTWRIGNIYSKEFIGE